MRRHISLMLGLLVGAWMVWDSCEAEPVWLAGSRDKVVRTLVERHGAGQRERLERGLRQVASLWREEDGGADAFEAFVTTHYAADQATLDAMFGRFEGILERVNGHFTEMTRALREQADLDRGPILPFDELFAGYAPAAHVGEDFFANKLAFVALLNFPLTSLAERLDRGDGWTRRQWAEARLAQQFSRRVPASVNLEVSRIESAAAQYIAEYNLCMHQVVDAAGTRLFPPGMKLLSHWNLRDEIKANYGDSVRGLARQRMVRRIMDRIVTQTIPRVVINNAAVDWDPASNVVKPAPAAALPVPGAGANGALGEREPDTRYAVLLSTYRAARLVDGYSPNAPTLMARRFEENRELPEERVRAMLEAVVQSPWVPRVAALIEKRLGRPLEAFDLWYAGFRPQGGQSQQALDALVARRYPTAAAYEADMPRMLEVLGFSSERARVLASSIAVDPARGSGHAAGAGMRGEKARLRTRVGASGMDYKGYNIAVHEMGHNVEQTISMNDVDHYLLNGVPNAAFTEAIAFVFQGRDLELLGTRMPDAGSEELRTLDDFWGTYEIAGVALLDMAVWRWMYAHPEAAPAELREATLSLARELWNRYYAPVLRERDVTLLAIYSHMIELSMYLPDYPIGHLISRQIEAHLRRAGKLGPEVERMVRTGSVTPDLWMIRATGKPVGPEALLEATERALRVLEAGRASGL